jgi:aminoglycoside phosphotransferase family enzyme/predicted kinase
VYDLERLIRELQDPRAYPEPAWSGTPAGARRVEVVQTHISVVFLTTHHAYKVKKPLSLWGLVDYATREARERCCHDEVRLNRRLAPDVYLGVVRIVERDGRWRVDAEDGADSGAARYVEPAVAMRRFRPEDTLEARVLAGSAGGAELRAVGARLAAFHAAHPLRGPALQALSARAHAKVLTQNVRSTRAYVPDLFDPRAHAALERRLAQGLCRLRGTLDRRLRAGAAVEGHGDLRLDHVLLEGGDAARVGVVDTVEFTTRLRHIDRLSDLAFLVMDLLAHGRRDLAAALLAGYGVAAEGLATLWHFAAYRAHVRAKVDATTAAEAEVPEAQRAAARLRARGHLVLAWTLAARGSLPSAVILMRGPSGSGKSVLASAIAPWLDAELVQSDVVRKALFGLAPLARPSAAERAEVYGEQAGERTYAEVLRRGLEAAGRGHVLLDATYLRADARLEAREAVERRGLSFRILDLQVEPALARERLRRRGARGDDPSDADVAVYERQVETQEPLTTAEAAVTLRTDPEEHPTALLMRLCASLDAEPGGPGGRSGGERVWERDPGRRGE